jgi:hypothetical protein
LEGLLTHQTHLLDTLIFTSTSPSYEASESDSDSESPADTFNPTQPTTSSSSYPNPKKSKRWFTKNPDWQTITSHYTDIEKDRSTLLKFAKDLAIQKDKLRFEREKFFQEVCDYRTWKVLERLEVASLGWVESKEGRFDLELSTSSSGHSSSSSGDGGDGGGDGGNSSGSSSSNSSSSRSVTPESVGGGGGGGGGVEVVEDVKGVEAVEKDQEMVGGGCVWDKTVASVTTADTSLSTVVVSDGLEEDVSEDAWF